jgi:hypothetical protein
MMQIREVLNRRTDLSTFVVHLTREREGLSARQALDAIASNRVLRAQTPLGWAKSEDDAADATKQTQRVVCFSETPLEHIYSLVADIEGRDIHLAPYGLAFTKLVARRMGINPVWYVDMTPGRDWVIRNAIESLRDAAIARGDFHGQDVARLTPFFEQMGTWPQRQKEFWWEREWRHVGDMPLPDQGIIWLCPEAEIEQLVDAGGVALSPVIDPRWGLEQIIAHLAGFSLDDVTPFAPHRAPPEVDWFDELGQPF